MSIESAMPFNHLILVLFSSHLQSFPASWSIEESVLRIRWPKYWSFSFSISPSNQYSGLISFRMDWVALLAIQETLKSLLQHHSSKASILRHSAFFIILTIADLLCFRYTTKWFSYAYTYDFFSLSFRFFSLIVYYKILSIFPCATQ